MGTRHVVGCDGARPHCPRDRPRTVRDRERRGPRRGRSRVRPGRTRQRLHPAHRSRRRPVGDRRRVRRVAGVLRPPDGREAASHRTSGARRHDRVHAVRRAGVGLHGRRRVTAGSHGGVLDRAGRHHRSVLRRVPRLVPAQRVARCTRRSARRGRRDRAGAAPRRRHRAPRDGARARPPRGVARGARCTRGCDDPLQPLPPRARLRTAPGSARGSVATPTTG